MNETNNFSTELTPCLDIVINLLYFCSHAIKLKPNQDQGTTKDLVIRSFAKNKRMLAQVALVRRVVG